MNVDLDGEQAVLQQLAAELFGRLVDVPRIEKAESSADRFDRELWSALAEAGLLGVVLPESHGGLGLGATELAMVLEQLGRVVAPVPLVATSLAGWCLAALGSDAQRDGWLPRLVDGSAVVAVAPARSSAGVRADATGLSGTVVAVPWAHAATAVLLPVDGSLFLLDLTGPGVTTVRGDTTAREGALDLTLDAAPAEPVGGPDDAQWLALRWRMAWGAVQAGVTGAAVQLAAAYTSEREQFGKPLSTFQAVALKAADAYLDATAIRATALQAAWALDQHPDAELEVLTAARWAADAGQHCVHLTQHLHGGMGADVTYPVHRYFLWGKEIELLLGGASALLAELGDALAERPDAGDAVVL